MRKSKLIFLVTALSLLLFSTPINAQDSGGQTILNYIESYTTKPSLTAFGDSLDEHCVAVVIHRDSLQQPPGDVSVVSSKDDIVTFAKTNHFDAGFISAKILEYAIQPAAGKNSYTVYVKTKQNYPDGQYEVSDSMHCVVSADGTKIVQVLHDMIVKKL